MKKASIASILLFMLLWFLLFLPQHTLADEEVRYEYPIIETNCDQINTTAYRFSDGDTLNFTCVFTTQEYVRVWFQKNFSYHMESAESISFTSTDFARIYTFICQDGTESSIGYELAPLSGEDRGATCLGYDKGEHTMKIIFLFKAYGYYEMSNALNFTLSFLSEPQFRIEKAEPPIPLIPLAGGISIAVLIVFGAVTVHRRSLARKRKN